MALRMDPNRIATQTASPIETDETAEEYGRDSVVSSPTSLTWQTVPFGAAVTIALRTRKQSRVSFWISSRTICAIASRKAAASDKILMCPPYLWSPDVLVVTLKSGISFTDVQVIDMDPVSPIGMVKP